MPDRGLGMTLLHGWQPKRCVYKLADSSICGTEFMPMTPNQEACAIHSLAHQANKTKERSVAKLEQKRLASLELAAVGVDPDKGGKPPAPMTDSANKLTNDLLKLLPAHFPGRFWRRNVGMAYPVSITKVLQAMLQRGSAAEALRYLQHSRPVNFGVPGEPDIDGFITIGNVAVKTGIEIKIGRDRQRETQRDCQAVYVKFGALYIIGHSVEQVVSDLRARVEILTKP